MFTYIIRRILLIFPTLFLIITLSFFFVRLAPGDPATAALGEYASPETIAALKELMGLNKSLGRQYIDYLSGLARGDLGRSLANQQEINQMVWATLPHSLILTVSGVTFGAIFGVILGVFSAVKRNSLFDQLARFFSLLGISMPSFYTGILLMLLFSVYLGWFPAIGAENPTSVGDYLYQLFLPALTMGIALLAFNTRVARSSFLNVLRQEYVTTARSKGLRERTVLFKHCLRNSLLSLVSVIGLYLVIMLGVMIMVEIVFNRAGVGKLMVSAVENRDFTLLQSTLVVFGCYTAIVNLIVDLSYVLIDPRVKYA